MLVHGGTGEGVIFIETSSVVPVGRTGTDAMTTPNCHPDKTSKSEPTIDGICKEEVFKGPAVTITIPAADGDTDGKRARCVTDPSEEKHRSALDLPNVETIHDTTPNGAKSIREAQRNRTERNGTGVRRTKVLHPR